jgi:hypothetical protein
MAEPGSPTQIPWPLSSFPGANSQESAGRLINCSAEPLGDPSAGRSSAPAPQVWRRQPGFSLFAITPEVVAYRGGLIVNNLSFEVWANVYTVDANGGVTLLGALPGTKKVSIAHNQRLPLPDVVAVDIDNGAYLLAAPGPVPPEGTPIAPTPWVNPGCPQFNSVCFQDGYFFLTAADGRCFASVLNSVTTINTITFITCQAKSDVILLRGIAFSGMLWLFTTGSCEIWQDVAGVAPAFPYGRLSVIEYGLVQANAIAGWETGFSVLIWVAQDFGVYLCQPGQFAPTKISPPDLDRLIEGQVRAGNLLEAGVYAYGGKKFWALSSPAWTWEFNLSTNKWNERWSLSVATGSFGRWRFTCGHPAFNKWLGGDQAGGNLLWIDVTNFSENGAVLLFRMESGPVADFPNLLRIARADFQFDKGVGIAVANVLVNVFGAAAGTGGLVRLTVSNTARMATNDTGIVSGITGTTEANGTWPLRIIDQTHVELIGSVFVHAYVSGGTLVDVTSPPNEINPAVAISLSKDGGNRWGNPLIRYLGKQGQTQRPRASVKSMGLSGPMGCRWRIDVSDPVYCGFLEATQASDARDVGA